MRFPGSKYARNAFAAGLCPGPRAPDLAGGAYGAPQTP